MPGGAGGGRAAEHGGVLVRPLYNYGEHSYEPLREMFLVLIGTLAFFLLLAIASYSPEDPSFNYTGANTNTHNLVGIAGAYLADFLLFLFGWMAYLLPMGLIYGALRLLKLRVIQANALVIGVRSSGWVASLLCSCVLMIVLGVRWAAAEGEHVYMTCVRDTRMCAWRAHVCVVGACVRDTRMCVWLAHVCVTRMSCH